MARTLSLAAIFFFACACSAQTLLFQEDFAGGTAKHRWNGGFNGSPLTPQSRSGNPSGDGWVGRLGNGMSGGGVGESYSPDGQFDDFYYEAKLYIPVDEATYYGIEFRVDSTGLTAGYQFIARFNPNGTMTPRLRFRVRTVASPAVPVALLDWENADVPGGIPTVSGWHTLGVKAVGNRFWFYFDGALLPNCPLIDDTFSSGCIGAYVWDSILIPAYLYIDDITVTSPLTGVAGLPPHAPIQPELRQNHPNPFASATRIEYVLPEKDLVRLSLVDRLGRERALILRDRLEAGAHAVDFHPAGLESGIYFIRLQTSRGSVTRKAVLIR